MKNVLQKVISDTDQMFSNVDFAQTENYSQWLAQTFYFVRHSTRLVALSASLVPFELNTLHKQALEHAGEESGHEILLLNDLRALSNDIAHFPESSYTKALWQSQYYAIQHIHPLAYLGYVLFLETLAVRVGERMLNPLEKAHGKKAASFVRVHAHEDVAHQARLIQTIQSFPQELQTVIENNLLQASCLYQSIIEEIKVNSKEFQMAA